MSRQPHLPGMTPGLASVRYDHAAPYTVTIVEYTVKDGPTGREWVCDTNVKPASEWVKELGLVMVPF